MRHTTKLICLTILLVITFGTQLFSQRVFSNAQQDWLAHQLIQLNVLREDSALQAQNLIDCDSARQATAIQLKASNVKFNVSDSTGRVCEKDNKALTNKYNKLVNKIKVFKNGLLITIPITIAEAFALWYVIRNKK